MDEPIIGATIGADPDPRRTNAAYIDFALAQGLALVAQ